MIIRLRRGLEANRMLFTPALGEPFFTTDTQRLYIGDGITPGGVPASSGGEGGGGGSTIDVVHRADKSNPHEVTKAQVGLSLVPNINFSSAISGLQSAVDGKQPLGSYATTVALSSGLAGKANTSHSHAIADVSGLASALNSKQPSGNYATVSELNEKGRVEAIVAGANIVVNNSDPRNPVVSAIATEDGANDHSLLSNLDADDHLQYHTDDRGDARYYKKTEVDAEIQGIETQLSEKSPMSHNHDNRYYTEFEVDAALIGKADLSHTHPVTDIQATGSSIGSKYLRGDGTWSVPSNTTYTEVTEAEITAGTATTLRTITGRRIGFLKTWVTTSIATAISALTKASVGLPNVDNTADSAKPVSTAQQAAIDAKYDKTGGTIAGDVDVTGQLNVDGDIYSNGVKLGGAVLGYTETSFGKKSFTTYNASPLSLTITTSGSQYITLTAVVPHGSTTNAANMCLAFLKQDGSTLASAAGGVGIPAVDQVTGQAVVIKRIMPTSGSHTYTLEVASYQNNNAHYIYSASPAILMIQAG